MYPNFVKLYRAVPKIYSFFEVGELVVNEIWNLQIVFLATNYLKNLRECDLFIFSELFKKKFNDTVKDDVFVKIVFF